VAVERRVLDRGQARLQALCFGAQAMYESVNLCGLSMMVLIVGHKYRWMAVYAPRTWAQAVLRIR